MVWLMRADRIVPRPGGLREASVVAVASFGVREWSAQDTACDERRSAHHQRDDWLNAVEAARPQYVAVTVMVSE
jgi:hypothetical protein